ncbi:hypothetical protein NE237_020715 [Protea cynaroides]|uniref:DRBM domain-containing protein n=1 Tax=Protea cynaroides TaxID=273540 RepID=A0A9Q0H9X1_9MAGN|nr:hypothetical protein NE237_020715 [Protea cynaroides]
MSETNEMAAASEDTMISSPGVSEHLFHKNRLQEYAQKAAIPLPLYQTVNEGFPHAPRFRSTVLVGGASYVTSETFSQRKEAEQAVAKYAIKHISEKIKNDGCRLIDEDATFCKSILHEFAVKQNLLMPSYRTTQSEVLLPMFVSYVSFNGKLYTGSVGKNKKEAEQLAARAVIKSIMGESDLGTCLSEIIMSKGKLYAAVHIVKDSGTSTSEKRDVVVPPGMEMPTHADAGTCQGQQSTVLVPVSDPCVHELKKPRWEPLGERTTGCFEKSLPVPYAGGSSQGALVTTDRVKCSQKKNKNQGQKRFRNEGSQAKPAINQTASVL